MNKKVLAGIILLVLSIILALNLSPLISAQAAGTCATGQVMLYLSSPTNAHGATGTSNYGTKICYDNVFRQVYNGTNPTTCTATNKIVRLSGTTNTHAERAGMTTTGYTDVCYGNLDCRTATTPQSCLENEKEILRLYQPTNSHLALNGTGVGGIAVCCKILGRVTGAHWENLIGQEITTTNVGNTVKMVVPGENLNNSQINYTIEKKDSFLVFFTTWEQIGSSTVQNQAFKEWTPTSAGTYRFNAEVQGSGTKQTSPELIVDATERNTPPTIAITSLIDGGIYFLTNTLNFTATVTDPDDSTLTYSWNTGEGTSTAPSLTYRYTRPGQKGITLRVTDGRGASAEAKVDILVVNSTYAFSYISTPRYGSVISGLSVTFDASQKSYVVNVTHNPDQIWCMAGNCPNQSADGSVPVNNTPAPITNINFSWKLSDNYQRAGLGVNYAVVPYQFKSAGAKGAEMNVSILPGTSSWTWTNFTLYLPSGVPYCSVSGSSSSWIISSGSTDSRNSCYRSNGQPSTTCCPIGYTCDTTSGNCLPGGAALCANYTTQQACNNYDRAVAENSVNVASGGNITCGNVIRQYEEGGAYYREVADNCRCEWASNVCQSNYNLTKECVDGSCTSINIGSCQVAITLNQDLCSTSQKIKIYKITANWTGTGPAPETCKDGTIEKSCVDFSQVKLPFFGTTQIIITIALIIAFYIYFHRKKK